MQVFIFCINTAKVEGGDNMANERISSFLSEMRSLKVVITTNRDYEAAKAYTRLEKFVRGCTYTSYKHRTQLVDMLLLGYKNDDISSYLGIQPQTVRYHESVNLSKPLYEIFGRDFFTLFREYATNKREIDRRLYLATRSDTSRLDYCTNTVLDLVNKLDGAYEPLESANLGDCTKELLFIIKHSKQSIEKEFDGLDVAKVEYLLRVLDGTAGTVDERFVFISRMEDL